MMGWVITKACDKAQEAREKALGEGESRANADKAAKKAYESDLADSAKRTAKAMLPKIFMNL